MNENAVKNRRILIKNAEGGQMIADTKILRFDSLTNSVYISADSLRDRKYYSISAYIFAEDGLYEFSGTIRGVMVGDEIEVFLGKSKEKEDRARTRYPVAMAGNITHVFAGGRKIRLRKPMSIETINMSAGGVLMKADCGCFHIGDGFTLKLKVEEGEIELDCRAVRIQNSTMLTEEYGCRILEIQIERDREQENAG